MALYPSFQFGRDITIADLRRDDFGLQAQKEAAKGQEKASAAAAKDHASAVSYAFKTHILPLQALSWHIVSFNLI